MVLVSLMRNSGKALQDNFLGASDVKIRVKVDQAKGKWHWLVGKVSHLQKSFLVVSATSSSIGKSVSAFEQVNFFCSLVNKGGLSRAPRFKPKCCTLCKYLYKVI